MFKQIYKNKKEYYNMLQNVYQKSIDFLYFNFDEKNGFLENSNLKDIIKSNNILYSLNFVKEANRVFLFLLKHLNNDYVFSYRNKHYSSIFFIETIILKINKRQNLEDDREVKKLIRLLEKIILKIIDSYNFEYLLIENKKNNFFYLEENLIFLKNFDDLFELFMKNNNLNLANKLQKIRDEIELSTKRYFLFEKQKILIEKFSKQKEIYKICDNYKILNLIGIFNLSEDFKQNILNDISKNLEEIKDNRVFLMYLIFLKKQNKNYEIFSNKVNEISKHFSQKTFESENEFVDFSQKLFLKDSLIHFENDKFYFKINDLKIVNLLIEITI